jgi:hypothetical protein
MAPSVLDGLRTVTCMRQIIITVVNEGSSEHMTSGSADLLRAVHREYPSHLFNDFMDSYVHPLRFEGQPWPTIALFRNIIVSGTSDHLGSCRFA